MTLRRAHGAARRGGRLVAVETLPPDEMPRGVAAPRRTAEAPVRQRPGGGFADRESAVEAGRRGGLAKRGATALADSLGLAKPDEYRRRADRFRRELVAYLRKHVGGGLLGPDVRALIKLAALQLAAAERAFDKGDDAAGSLRGIEARQTIATAREYAALEAHHRDDAP